MTRLADALQRANDRRDEAPDPRVPVAAADAAAPRVSIPGATPAARRVSVPASDAAGLRVPVPAPKPFVPRKPAMAAPVTDPRPAVVLDRRTETPVTEVGGTSLIGRPSRDVLTSWRTDPELVGKIVGTDGFSGAAQEQYRKLAAILHHAQGERGVKVIMTSSALPGEGKSLTAVNLALTLSESYHRRVLLIDADLRRPTVQRIFGIPPLSGLNEGLKASEDRPMALTSVSDRLFVLPAGRPEADPMSGLTSERMRRLITQAAACFEWVIVDSPPVGLLPDASLLSAFVDGVLLVVRAGKAPFSLVKRTVDSITHERILGVVMNAIDLAHDRNAGGYYEYYGAGYAGTSTK
jgi:capsular exopolysaccharide synthesis family protein